MFRAKRYCAVATTAALLFGVPAHAQRLLETDGVELRGSARIAEYSAGICRVRPESHSETEYARIAGNDGQALDVWELEFSVHNGSGRPLEHLIARYGIESRWPPCTNWDLSPGADRDPLAWSDVAGHVQRSGSGSPVRAGETIRERRFVLVFQDDPAPRFANWSLDFKFAGDRPTSSTDASEQTPEVAERDGAPTHGARQPAATGADWPLCANTDKIEPCWRALEGRPDCRLLDGSNNPGTQVRLAGPGDCVGGKLSGAMLKLEWSVGGATESLSGAAVQGVRQGQWTAIHPGGTYHTTFFDGLYWSEYARFGEVTPEMYAELSKTAAVESAKYAHQLPWGAAENRNASPDMLAILADHEDDTVRRYVAANPSTEAEVLAILAKDEGNSVREAVASNSSTEPEVLAILAKDQNFRSVRRAVARNPTTPVATLYGLSLDVLAAPRSSEQVAEALACNEATPAGALRTLSGADEPLVRAYVANRADLPAAVRASLRQDADELVRCVADSGSLRACFDALGWVGDPLC